jgi:hypothetical protein
LTLHPAGAILDCRGLAPLRRNPMDPSLPKPTVALVHAEEQNFDRDNEMIERALTELIKQFPKNTDMPQILIKVAAINQLYSTNIYAVWQVAAHIAKLNIDADLEVGEVQLVRKIAQVTIGNKQRNNLSFASKYCSWHQPKSYPIYDSRAEACLWAYREQFGLAFARKDLWEYESYFEAVKEFRDRFELGHLTFKQIDKFLYLKGVELLEKKEQARTAGKQASAEA